MLNALAKSGAGIGTPMNLTGDETPTRLFLCRAFSYTQIMVGWAGAPQGAPVSVRPVVPTPFSPPP
ncbi:ash family protein [Brenneria tiliae]|uniref:ash family protein n=1 Tax=Brenneria tiliae TaxID=2914984 RepID=UPI003F69068C